MQNECHRAIRIHFQLFCSILKLVTAKGRKMLHRSLFILFLYLVQVLAKKDCHVEQIYVEINETAASLVWKTEGNDCEGDQKYKVQLDEVLTSTSSILFKEENTTGTTKEKDYVNLQPCTNYIFRIWPIFDDKTIGREENKTFVLKLLLHYEMALVNIIIFCVVTFFLPTYLTFLNNMLVFFQH